MFYNICLLINLFISPQDLRAPSADRRTTLPRDQYLGALYNASPKIRGPPLKNFGAKNMLNLARLIQRPTLIANIFATTQDIQNRKPIDRERFLPRLEKQVR